MTMRRRTSFLLLILIRLLKSRNHRPDRHGFGSGTNNVVVKCTPNQLDRVDEIALFWVVSIAELAGAAGS